MVTPVDVNYFADSGEDVWGGRSDDRSVLSLAASTMTPGDFVTIDSSSLNTKVDNLYPNDGRANDEFTDWAVSGSYDPSNDRIYISGAPANTLSDEGASTTILQLDIKTNTWVAIRNPWGVATGHCYDSTAFCDDILYKSGFGTPNLRYNVETDTVLADIGRPPTTIGAGSASWSTIDGSAFHPNMGVQGSLVWANSSLGRTCRYDIASDTWSLLHQAGNVLASAPVCHYSAFSDKVIFGVGRTTDPLYIVDAGESVTTTDNCPANLYAAADGVLFAADPNSAKSILIMDNGEIHSLDHDTGQWTAEGMTPGEYPDNRNSKRWIAPTTKDGVFVIVDYSSNGNSIVYLYRYS